MKVSKRCPKCHGMKVGFLERVVDKGRVSDEEASVGVNVHRDGGWLLREVEFIGTLEAYVCGDCGYFEHYVRNPESVAFESLTGFKWVNDPPPASGGAYR